MIKSDSSCRYFFPYPAIINSIVFFFAPLEERCQLMITFMLSLYTGKGAIIGTTRILSMYLRAITSESLILPATSSGT